MKHIKTILASIALVITSLIAPASAFADTQGFTMSPMQQKIVINPGDSFTSSVKISNPGLNDKNVSYTITVEPFYVDNDYKTIFTEDGMSYNQIVKWITVDSPLTGTLTPNESTEIHYTINVPSDAPAGGQYAAIVATASANDPNTSMSIQERQAIAHTIFAEITGKTIRQGEILDASVPSFLTSGDIIGSSTIRNTGNVHGNATYTMQISSVFGGGIVYSNVDDPEIRTIVPDRTLTNEITWNGTPPIGLFNVTYTAQFEGVTKEVSKLVIICPVYLIILIIVAVAALIIWLIFRISHSPKRQMR